MTNVGSVCVCVCVCVCACVRVCVCACVRACMLTPAGCDGNTRGGVKLTNTISVYSREESVTLSQKTFDYYYCYYYTNTNVNIIKISNTSPNSNTKSYTVPGLSLCVVSHTLCCSNNDCSLNLV